MKKLFVLIAALALITYGCKKDQPQPTNQLVDVSFTGVPMSKDLGGTKVDACFAFEADWAVITIDDVDYTVDVYYIDGVPYTKSIKLTPGQGEGTDGKYVMTKFLLYSDYDTPEVEDDGILAAAPEADADFGQFVIQGLPLDITVQAFNKVEIPVEVLCFEAHQFSEFGFFWYTYDEVVVRKQCFFGDLCVKHPDDYLTSLYAGQDGGLQMDMPAIFQIEMIRNNVPFGTFNNESFLGEGAPLCVEYVDYLNEVDNYEFILSVLVRIGSGFGYVPFGSWTFTDDGLITAGTDGVVDFVVGNCVQDGADFVYAPYMNLPVSCTMNIHNPGDPGYWDLTVIDVTPDGDYDLNPDSYDAWCGDKDHSIGNGEHTAKVYSSLNPASWPTGMPTGYAAKIAKVNWIFNHLSYYGLTPVSITQADGLVLQNAIWAIINGWGVSGDAADMRDDANAWATANGNFVPLPGGYAAVLFVTDDNPAIQLIFTLVDP
jgi:hypothetical protein